MGAEREMCKTLLGNTEAKYHLEDAAIVKYWKALGISTGRN
jgi:hypothetical protein